MLAGNSYTWSRCGSAVPAPDPVHYPTMRAWMWSRARDFLQAGAIDKDARLGTDLAGPSVRMDKQDRVCLESKDEMERRGLDSPNDGDPRALTFAHPVLPQEEDLEEDEEEFNNIEPRLQWLDEVNVLFSWGRNSQRRIEGAAIVQATE